MDWRGLFTLQHHQVHSRALSVDDGDFHMRDILLRDMSGEQLRLSPRDDQNSVVRLLWHIAHCEDVVGGEHAGWVVDFWKSQRRRGSLAWFLWLPDGTLLPTPRRGHHDSNDDRCAMGAVTSTAARRDRRGRR